MKMINVNIGKTIN